MILIGIDPGLTGAMAVITERGQIVSVYDTPVLAMGGKGGNRHVYDLPAMLSILRLYCSPGMEAHAAIEKLHGIPIKSRRKPDDQSDIPGMGSTTSFAMGLGYGVWLMGLVAAGIKYTEVPPPTWRKAMLYGLPKGKDTGRLRAQQLFPGADLKFKKHHGRADALLLAEYLRRSLVNSAA